MKPSSFVEYLLRRTGQETEGNTENSEYGEEPD